MTEIEVPVEQVQEQLHHEAQHSGDAWISRIALSSAVLAALAAVAALLAGHHSNEAMIDQIKASDSWSYFQSKSIKGALLGTKISVLEALGKAVPAEEGGKLEEYRKEQTEISATAKEKEHSSAHHLHIHEILARAVTLFQIAITLGAISALTRRRHFWFVSLAFGILGIGFMTQGMLFSH